MKYIWTKWKHGMDYIMRFRFTAIEVIRERNKKESPCDKNWKQFDEKLFEQHLLNVGCRAAYQKTSGRNISLCNSAEKMSDAKFDLMLQNKKVRSNRTLHMLLPCKKIEKVFYVYEETSYESVDEHFWFQISLFDHTFKESEQSRLVYNRHILILKI